VRGIGGNLVERHQLSFSIIKKLNRFRLTQRLVCGAVQRHRTTPLKGYGWLPAKRQPLSLEGLEGHVEQLSREPRLLPRLLQSLKPSQMQPRLSRLRLRLAARRQWPRPSTQRSQHTRPGRGRTRQTGTEVVGVELAGPAKRQAAPRVLGALRPAGRSRYLPIVEIMNASLNDPQSFLCTQPPTYRGSRCARGLGGRPVGGCRTTNAFSFARASEASAGCRQTPII
jgi:hypothetical protein